MVIDMTSELLMSIPWLTKIVGTHCVMVYSERFMAMRVAVATNVQRPEFASEELAQRRLVLLNNSTRVTVGNINVVLGKPTLSGHPLDNLHPFVHSSSFNKPAGRLVQLAMDNEEHDERGHSPDNEHGTPARDGNENRCQDGGDEGRQVSQERNTGRPLAAYSTGNEFREGSIPQYDSATHADSHKATADNKEDHVRGYGGYQCHDAENEDTQFVCLLTSDSITQSACHQRSDEESNHHGRRKEGIPIVGGPPNGNEVR